MDTTADSEEATYALQFDNSWWPMDLKLNDHWDEKTHDNYYTVVSFWQDMKNRFPVLYDKLFKDSLPKGSERENLTPFAASHTIVDYLRNERLGIGYKL